MSQNMLATSPIQTTSSATPTRRQQVVARLLGAQSFAGLNWRQLMQDGVLIQLHIGRCRFTTRLLLEDMGIQVEDEAVRQKLSRWVILGEKRLLPEAYMKALARIESGARYALKEHAFRTELGAFVPVTAYLSWREKTEALQREYLELRDNLIANHQDLIREVLSEYEAIAADTYQRLRTTNPDLVSGSETQFVTSYCNRLAEQIPSVQRIRESFTFHFFRTDSLSHLGSNFATSSEATLSEATDAETVSDLRLSTEQRSRQRAILEHDLQQDAQARVNTMLDSFLTSIVGQLRTLTYDAVCDVLSTLERKGGEHFSPRSTMQLNNLLTQIRSLNFFGDTEIDQMMRRVQQIVEMSPAERNRSLGDIGRTLRAIATTTRATLLELEEEPRPARADLGIPAFPTEQSIHQARAELALPALNLTSLALLPPATRTARAELSAPDDLWRYVERTSPNVPPTGVRPISRFKETQST